MKKHTKIYLNYFGYQIPEDVFCEVCRSPAVDIHHIDSRGMGGDPQGKKDVIENLQALCRACHDNYGDDPSCFDKLTEVHLRCMEINGNPKGLGNVGTPAYDVTPMKTFERK